MIKVGFIGTGGISAVHLDYLKNRKDVKIAGLADVNLENARKRQSVYGGEIFADFKAMLAQIKPDAVWLCTPSMVRKEPLLACAERGIPVFCEKPAERRLSHAVAIGGALTKRKAHVQVGYVFRYLPVIARLREAMRGDNIHLVQSFYCCGMSLKMSARAWFYDKARSGGALVDQATHNLDLLRYLFGEVREIYGMSHNPVRKKGGHYTIEETIGIVFKFAGGMLGSHMHSWVGDSWRNEIVLSGEKRLYRLQPGSGKLSVEQLSPAANDPVRGIKAGPKAGPFQYAQDNRSIYEYENEAFLRQIKSGNWRLNQSDYPDAVKSLVLTQACDRAVMCGHRKIRVRPRQ